MKRKNRGILIRNTLEVIPIFIPCHQAPGHYVLPMSVSYSYFYTLPLGTGALCFTYVFWNVQHVVSAQ